MDTQTLKIIKYPDPRLRKRCEPVKVFDDSLVELSQRMFELMHAANGIGLAAPQVGILIRLFVCNLTGEPADDRVYINPELSNLGGQIEGEEGCLSIPEVSVSILRAASGTMNACDLNGRPIEIAETDLVVRCWQHECDHIDGRLTIDYMSEADKIANRRVLKQLEAQYKDA